MFWLIVSAILGPLGLLALLAIVVFFAILIYSCGWRDGQYYGKLKADLKRLQESNAKLMREVK